MHNRYRSVPKNANRRTLALIYTALIAILLLLAAVLLLTCGLMSAVSLGAVEGSRSIGYTDLMGICPSLPDIPRDAMEQAEIHARYDGYIEKQYAQVRRMRALEETPLPADMDYRAISGLRLEAREKLSARRPMNLGQASRISGVSPADISVLMVALRG